MATCRAQTSLQPPLALPDTSSHCLLGFLLFFFIIAEMKTTSKLRPPHPSAKRPLQGVRGSFLSVNCPHADITSSNVHISPVLRCFRKCAKMRTFESERVKALLPKQVWSGMVGKGLKEQCPFCCVRSARHYVMTRTL